ncbi:MAG: PD-(D/E)XK motif protein [Bacilli bacterium]|nr:PD-(D/E)XK motif protein [Bacilli bacterium]
MKTTKEIKELLNNIPSSNNGYNLVTVDEFMWGKGKNNEIVFGFISINKKITPLIQTTSHLKLYINNLFEIKIDNKNVYEKMSLLVLKTINLKYVEVFINLILSMIENLNEEKLLNHFLEIKALFSNERKISKYELEGMWGELFSMYNLKQYYNIDISKYYQKEAKRKFDFSVTDKKKIEIKSTLKPERIHHFLHQQLDTDRFDIMVISIKLQKDDKGLSLFELIKICKTLFSNNFEIILYIETIVKNIEINELEELKFNLEYAKSNFKIFDALTLPRIKEKNVDGIFNVEYDVDFSNIKNKKIEEFNKWLLTK